MGHRVCPWWLGYFLISPLRRWRQYPAKILNGYARTGMTAQSRPRHGLFQAGLVAYGGTVWQRRGGGGSTQDACTPDAAGGRAGLLDRLDPRIASPESMPLTDVAASVDFTLAFAVVHEFPDAAHFFRQVSSASKPGASLLLAEPKGHVKLPKFERELNAAFETGFRPQSCPSVAACHATLLERG